MHSQESDLISQTQHWELLAITWPSERQEVTLSVREEEPEVNTPASPKGLVLRKNLREPKGGGDCLHKEVLLDARCLSAESHSFLICREWNRDPGPRIAWVPRCKAIEPWHWDSKTGSDGDHVWVLLTKLEQTCSRVLKPVMRNAVSMWVMQLIKRAWKSDSRIHAN